MTPSATIKSIELASDLKGFVESNYEDVFFEAQDIENNIQEFNDDDLVLVEKRIASPTTIISVKIVNEELIAQSFS